MGVAHEGPVIEEDRVRAHLTPELDDKTVIADVVQITILTRFAPIVVCHGVAMCILNCRKPPAENLVDGCRSAAHNTLHGYIGLPGSILLPNIPAPVGTILRDALVRLVLGAVRTAQSRTRQ